MQAKSFDILVCNLVCVLVRVLRFASKGGASKSGAEGLVLSYSKDVSAALSTTDGQTNA